MKQLISSILFGLLCMAALGQEEGEQRDWSNQAELSAVWTGGNSESSTFGFRNEFQQAFAQSQFILEAKGMRAESTTTARVALQTVDGIEVIETETTETTAENYLVNAKYRQDMKERFFWLASGAWLKNEFSGIQNRYTATLGLGNTWAERERFVFRSEYGFQLTSEEPVSGETDDYLAGLVQYELKYKFGNAVFDQSLEAVANLDDANDFRVDFSNHLTVAINGSLSLKASLQLLYDHQPTIQLIPVQNGESSVPFELEEWDTFFTTSLAIDF